MSQPGTKISTPGWVIGVTSVFITGVLYYADLLNIPVIAPYLDLVGDKVYLSAPILRGFTGLSPMLVSSAIIGLALFVIASVLAACFAPPSRIGALERHMGAIQQKRKNPFVRVK